VFHFLFVATCCLVGDSSCSWICTGTINQDYQTSFKIVPGTVIVVEVDLKVGTVTFAIDGKLVGRVTEVPKGVFYFGVCLLLFDIIVIYLFVCFFFL
jgi:hypothetical protein